MSIFTDVAKKLLEIEAVKLNPIEPFDWSKGWKSPIYCDNRVVLSYTEYREFVRDRLLLRIREEFLLVDAICGVAMAGISMGAILADHMRLPYAYIREPKKHGMKNSIEGRLKPGSFVVIFDDTISSGQSAADAIVALQNEGYKVVGIIAILNYGFKEAQTRSNIWNIPFCSVTNLNAICEVAERDGYIQPNDIQIIKKFADNPSRWYEKYYKK